MEIMEQVDILALILWEGWIPTTLMDTIDSISEDLKSPGGNTVWVRSPPALPCLEKISFFLFNILCAKYRRGTSPVPCLPDTPAVSYGITDPLRGRVLGIQIFNCKDLL